MGDLEVTQKSLPSASELYNANGSVDLSNLSELKIGAGSSIFYTDKEGSRWGHTLFDSAKAWIKIDGTAQFKTASGDVLLSTSATDGNFVNVINTALNTASKTILTDFTFESTDYAGAFKAGNPTWDENSGLITGGSGVIINARGILGANAGTATFTLDATTGNATFAGTLAAASGTLGTITSGTITGATIQTASTGYRVVLDSSNGVQLYNSTTQVGIIKADTASSIIIDSDDNIYLYSGGNQMAFFTSDSLDMPSGYILTWAGYGRVRATSAGLYVDGSTGGVWGLVVEGNVFPHSDNDHTCGASDKRWSKGHFEDIEVDDLTVNTGCSGCGYAELNYLTDKQKEDFFAAQDKKFIENEKGIYVKNLEWKRPKATEFEEGDVLAWKNGKLIKCATDACKCIRGVANTKGIPIIFGAELIKVTGEVRENQFLVGSTEPGFARAWNEDEDGQPPVGSVIGQAMEDKFGEDKKKIMASIFKR